MPLLWFSHPSLGQTTVLGPPHSLVEKLARDIVKPDRLKWIQSEDLETL